MEADIDEAQLHDFSEYKKRLNMRAAEAQVLKIELDMCDPSIDKATLKKGCQEANSLKLGAICVLPNAVKLCVNMLGKNPQTALIACISYPYGGDITKIKVKAAQEAIIDGVDEVEVTAPIACVKDGDWGYIKREFKVLQKITKKRALRVNIECSLLTSAELAKLCTLATECGITSIRASSGFCGKGFNAEQITTIKNAVKDKCTIKADDVCSLGELETALSFGAEIIGSKNAVDIARLVLKAAE